MKMGFSTSINLQLIELVPYQQSPMCMSGEKKFFSGPGFELEFLAFRASVLQGMTAQIERRK